ncbi:MAG: FtsW/RodA/SpoVE family cell cycle protein [Synergistaceae bacterium]|nr:FtsW/RodA/SpoVE family cell cycle protein [Synergistaceae bacterium]
MTRSETAPSILDEPVRMDFWLWLIPLIMSGLGILMVTSTTSSFVYDVSGSPFTMGIRQFRSLGFGFLMMLFTICIPTRFWRNIASFMWAMSVIMLVGTLIPGVGSAVGGANRWLRIAGVSIQPSEIVVLAVVLEMGKLFEKHSEDPSRCFRAVLALIVITALPLLRQPDLGSVVLLVLICMGMFVERFGWKLPLATGSIGVLLLLFLVKLEPYRMRRWNAFMNPHADPLNTGFQTIQGLIAFANGGVWGAGLGHGFQKLQYLPAAYTDFIYAALGEELGLLGTLGLLVLMTMWMTRCHVLYRNIRGSYEMSIVWGITLTVLTPFFINVGGVTNLIPLTGMPLPFVSYGGSSLVMSWVRIGILLRLQRDISKDIAS